MENANTRLTAPDAKPLVEATQVASVSDTLRVRLLSTPHAKHAPSTASAGHNPENAAFFGQARIAAPATMAAMPSAMRRSKFSLKANQARRAVNTLSALSNSEAPEADMPLKPTMSSTGPIMPPDRIAPASQIRVCRAWHVTTQVQVLGPGFRRAEG